MKRIRNKCIKPVIFFLIITIQISASASSDETFKFERMWPIPEQPWYFYKPWGIAIDRDGFVYVADSQNNRIQKFTSDGQFITKWKNTGSRELDSPADIAVDSYGFVYVTDSRNGRILKFDAEGQLVKEWGKHGSGQGEFSLPYGIVVSMNDYIYVTDAENHNVQKFTLNGLFVTKWGNNGNKDGEFNWPYGIAVDRKGFVYIADSENNRVQKFSEDGEFIGTWGEEGDEDGEFNWPLGIAICNDGFIYVTDMENHRIQKFSSEGKFIGKWGTRGNNDGDFNSPDGIAADESAFIYVADRENNRIQKFDSDGKFITRWGPGNSDGEFNSPDGIAIDEKGFVYVADTKNNRIQKFEPYGEFVAEWGSKGSGIGELGSPGRIAVYNDYVYVADRDNSRIQKFSADGQFVGKWGNYGHGNGEFNLPYGIALDKNGCVYVADRRNNRIQKFDTQGTFVAAWGCKGSGNGEFIEPHGIATGKNGNVYVADTGNNRIQVFSPDGVFINKWGKQGKDIGEFEILYDITVDSGGSVYAVDSGNHRIQKFTTDGQFIAVWGEEGSYPGQVKFPGAGAVGPNGNYYIADNHNHRIQVFKQFSFDSNTRAIIVAGGGPYPGNNLWNATRLSANFAYRTLRYQGIAKEMIYYLSFNTELDLDSDGKPDDVDKSPTNKNLSDAIIKWADGEQNLILYLVDHGGHGRFRINDMETLSAADLASWLNIFQSDVSKKVIVIYDACNSGSFLPFLASSEKGERIVITSTSADEDAYFISQGSLSFSNFFWTNIFNGYSVGESFQQAHEAVSKTTIFQNPQMDCTGNFTGNEPEDCSLAMSVYIGNGTPVNKGAPVIGGVFEHKVIKGTNSALLEASMATDNDEIAHVWAVIIPPGYNRESSNRPVLELPCVDLIPTEHGPYKGTYDGFNIHGTYQIAVYARDRLGNTSHPELTSVSVEYPLKRKAIIVAGGSRSDKNWEVIERNAGLAYNALKSQWYTDEDIYFMCSDAFSEGWDRNATLNNLNNDAIGRWASENTYDLVIYFIGRGGERSFQINTEESLSATALDTWLDFLQAKIPGKIVVIIDADYSGSFIPLLSPPEGRERIIISSVSSDQPAHFLSQETISFSDFFWKNVMNGSTVWDAFFNARESVGFFTAFQTDKTSLLDADGNGIANERDDTQLARYYTIGVGIKADASDPSVGSPRADKKNATIWVENVTTTSTIEKVWAVITPPDYDLNPASESGILELNHVGMGRYEGNYSDFPKFGAYQVAVYAKDTEGNVSLSEKTSVYQSKGPDIYENDDIPDQATFIVVNDETHQHRSFHDPGDEDWVKFYGISGIIYTTEVSNRSIDSDAVIELYGPDSATRLISSVQTIMNWGCLREGIYYIKIKNMNTQGFGENTPYDFKIYHPTGPSFSGYIKGNITSIVSGQAIADAKIRTDAAGSALSSPDGRYLMIHEPGKFTMTIEANGYKSVGHPSISVSEGGTTVKNFMLEPYQSPGSSFSGYIRGSITNAVSGESIAKAEIKTDAGAYTFSRPDGRYLMIHEPGSFTITVQAEGYKSESYSNISVSEGEASVKDFNLEPLPFQSDDLSNDTEESSSPGSISLPSDSIGKTGCFINAVSSYDSFIRCASCLKVSWQSVFGVSITWGLLFLFLLYLVSYKSFTCKVLNIFLKIYD